MGFLLGTAHTNCDATGTLRSSRLCGARVLVVPLHIAANDRGGGVQDGQSQPRSPNGSPSNATSTDANLVICSGCRSPTGRNVVVIRSASSSLSNMRSSGRRSNICVRQLIGRAALRSASVDTGCCATGSRCNRHSPTNCQPTRRPIGCSVSVAVASALAASTCGLSTVAEEDAACVLR